ncbi:MAG: FG-GAP-like repeat-containing protein, partial [Propionibacteriaceae bacterium]|nr:FG-GAP-like repeat-containing protein [Propionibacteriaceae bacterium]
YIADVQAWYRENTGQAFVFTVNAVKTLTSANVCGETGNTTASWTQAAALFGRSSYSAYESGGNGTHLIVLENLTYCPNASYVGLGSTSRSPGYAQGGEVTVRVDKSDWRRGVVDLSHELGHNFGLNHSNEWLCSSRSGTSNWNQADSNGSCAALEYADLFEFMGYGIEPGAMDAVRKYQTGLLQTSAVKVIDTAATATPVTLKPVPTTDNTSVELAYVKDSVPPGSTADSTFSGLPYLVEYRHITDPWYGGERWGVEVLRADASETWLLQPTTTWPLYYVSDEVLDVGDTFTSIGGLISVTVTAMNSSSATVTITRQESATSIATVAITGTAQVGNTVTASATGVTPAGAALAYQWLRNGTAIAGATASTYALAAADANTSLAAKVTATATGYSASAATSAAVLVASGTLTPATPTITGTTRSADTLTANPGTWTPAGVTFAYQWLRDGTTIAGATAKTYTLQAADVGKKLTVAVTGTLAGYTPRTMTSAATAVVAPGCTTGTPVKPMTRFTLGVDMTSDSRGETLAVDKQGTLWAYQGTATGALGAACQLGSGFAPAQVFGPGDLDGDGKADVLAITANGDLWLYPGDGPSLKTAIQVGSGWTGWRLVPTGDLTGDGKADLLGINAKGALFLYSGKGDGHFQTRVQVGSGWTGWDLYAAGDLNADKKADILGINASGALFQYTGKGTGLFNPRVQAGSGWTGWQLAAGADLTGDGQADIIGRNNKTGDLNFYKGLGNAKFATKVLVDTGW